MLAVIVGYLLAVLAAVFESVAFAAHLKDVDVMCQSVQQCPCQSLRAKDLCPFIKGQI